MSKRKNPETSLLANEAATIEMRQQHYGKIISCLKALGSATYEEMAEWIGFSDRNRVSRRLKEMEGLQLVCKLGTTRKTKSGRSANVYCLVNSSQPKTENELKYLKGESSATDYAKKIISTSKDYKQESLF